MIFLQSIEIVCVLEFIGHVDFHYITIVKQVFVYGNAFVRYGFLALTYRVQANSLRKDRCDDHQANVTNNLKCQDKSLRIEDN